jgi:hypothetical protein
MSWEEANTRQLSGVIKTQHTIPHGLFGYCIRTTRCAGSDIYLAIYKISIRTVVLAEVIARSVSAISVGDHTNRKMTKRNKGVFEGAAQGRRTINVQDGPRHG